MVPGKFFEKMQKLDKVYRRFYQNELREYHFTPGEIQVLLFLHNNAPEMDTASDIVRCKGVSKALIARSVDSLCSAGYLETTRDPDDRRIVHLLLTEKTRLIQSHIEKRQSALVHSVERNISPEALAVTEQTLEQLLENTELLLKEMEDYGE